MVFRKFRPAKQWGKADTRIFKEMLKARNKRQLPTVEISQAFKQMNAPVYDPNDPNFFSGNQRGPDQFHPAFSEPPIEEHPLFKSKKCLLFDGSVAFTDGIDQACSLTKAIKRNGFPNKISELASKLPIPSGFGQRLRDCIMQGERFDPTIEKLPRLHDPVIFWTNYYPNRMHGTPLKMRSDIVLDNLFRTVHLMAVEHAHLQNLRYDRDEPLSVLLNLDLGDHQHPFVLRSQPRLIVQSAEPIKPWIKALSLRSMREPDISPINPQIDLTFHHVYNDHVVLPRAQEPLFVDTVMWSHVQDQKYPWTMEELGAKAVMMCFAAAVAQATRHGRPVFESLEEQPIVTRAVQLTNGRLDLVVYQLNTLDLSSESRAKNIVWIEPGLQLYKPGKFTENYDEVVGLNTETFRKLMALLLIR